MTSLSAMVRTRRNHHVSRWCRTILFTIGVLFLQYECEATHAPPLQSQAASTRRGAYEDVKAPQDAEVDFGVETVAEASDSLSEVKDGTSKERQVSTALSKAASTERKSTRSRTSGDSLASNKEDEELKERAGEETEKSRLRNPPNNDVKSVGVAAHRNANIEGKLPASHIIGSKGAPSVEANSTATKHLSGKGVEGQEEERKKEKNKGAKAPSHILTRTEAPSEKANSNAAKYSSRKAVEDQGKKRRREKNKRATDPLLDPQAPIEELLDPAKIHRQSLTKTPFSQLTVTKLPVELPARYRFKKKTDGEVYQEAQEVYAQAKAVQANYDKNSDIAEAKASPPRRPSMYTRFMEAADRFFARWGKE